MSEKFLFPLGGGVLIGVAVSILWIGIGRIAGISGMLGESLKIPSPSNFWRYAFLLGLLSGIPIVNLFDKNIVNYQFDFSLMRYSLAGLLVGFGTRLGGGCTSGHGICGLSRLAKRSIVATFTFIFTAILVVTLERLFS